MVRIVDFVDEGFGHSSHPTDLGDCDVSLFDGGPDTWSTATGVALEVEP
jgi:hypothetical protein